MGVKLFDALHGCYFSTVYHILKEAGSKELTDKEYRELIGKMSDTYGFPGLTNMIVGGAINLGENEEIEDNKDAWSFFDKEKKEEKNGAGRENRTYDVNKSRLKNISDFPLSYIEKRWLKSLYSDARIRLFLKDTEEPAELCDIEPLFSWDDFALFDRYDDGDPFEDEHYIEMFHKVLKGVHSKSRLEIKFKKPSSHVDFKPDGAFEIEPDRGIGTLYIDPEYLEYSERDDKFRLIGNNPRFGRNMVNIASIVDCREVEKINVPNAEFQEGYLCDDFQREVIFELVDAKNALERFLLNFSHYEKATEYLREQEKYRITINYDDTDETDLVIRTLSFGPHVKVVEPRRFVELIKDRLWQQMEGLY